MIPLNQRRAGRLEVGIPVQIHTRAGSVHAVVHDLSRTGLRLRVSAEALGLKPNSNLEHVAKAIVEILRNKFALDMRYEQLGPLLRKNVVLRRVGPAVNEPGCFDICVAFAHELEDEETSYLQMDEALPELTEAVEFETPESGGGEALQGSVTFVPTEPESSETAVIEKPSRLVVHPGLPRQRYRALVSGLKADAPASFFCHTDLVTAIGVRVRLGRDEVVSNIRARPSAGSALNALIKSYGDTLKLRLILKERDVFQGPVSITGVEMPDSDPDHMLVTLAFRRQLTLSEVRDLQLESPA